MIIGLTGYAQSGKDTVANFLINQYGFKRVAFADKIRELAYASNPIVKPGLRLQDAVDQWGWEKAKVRIPEVRRLLQELGMGGRELFGDIFWIQQALRQVHFTENWVITDVRFENEANMIKKYDNAQIWRIRRNDVGAVNDHISETQMDGYKVDQIFMNKGTIEDLEALIKARMIGLLA